MLVWLVVLVAVWVVGSVLFSALTGIGIAPLPDAPAHPAANPEAAAVALRALEDRDGPEVAPACRTQLLRPQGPARGTLVIWHGFTNCPAQFAEVAEELCAHGYFVLVPRMPRHGNSDVLTRDLTDLTASEIVEFGGACIDVAAGLPRPLSAIGLSVGATLAAWAGATRPEVTRVIAMAPLVVPKGIPAPIARLLVRVRAIVPDVFMWWDPRRKADLGESPYVYPGFPLPGLVAFLHLGEALLDRKLRPRRKLERVVLVDNPGDFAIRHDAARAAIRRTFAGRAESLLEFDLEPSLHWWHDFVDLNGRHHGTTEQVAALLLEALGDAEGDDRTAGGMVATQRPLGKQAAS